MGEQGRHVIEPPLPRPRRRVPLWAVVVTGLLGLAVGGLAARPSGHGRPVVGPVTTTVPIGEGAGPSTTDDPITFTEETSQGDLSALTGFTTVADGEGTVLASVGALVTNANDSLAAYDVAVVFSLLDDAGRVVDSATEIVPYLPPGSTVPVAPSLIGLDLPVAPVSLRVSLGGTFSADDGWAGASFTAYDGVDLVVSGALAEPGTSGTEVSLTVVNPTDRPTDVAAWSCVLVEGGRIVGGASGGITEPIGPGSGSAARVQVPVAGLRPDEVRCRAWA